MLLLARQGNTEWFGQNGMRQRSQGEEVCWIETSCGEGGGKLFLFFSFLPPIQTKTDKVFCKRRELPLVTIQHQRLSQGIGIMYVLYTHVEFRSRVAENAVACLHEGRRRGPRVLLRNPGKKCTYRELARQSSRITTIGSSCISSLIFSCASTAG